MYLSWIDYVVLILLLIFSGGIGIYQGCTESKQTSTKEFLVADGRMKIWPTAMSLYASLASAASLLGTPVKIYHYGTMYAYVCMLYKGFITMRHRFYLTVYLKNLLMVHRNIYNNEILRT